MDRPHPPHGSYRGAVHILWAAGGAAAGLVAGGMLRPVVFRLSVPAGEPERSTCPRCAAPLGRWPATVCPYCGHLLGPPVLPELATAVVLGLLFGRYAGAPEAVAFAFLGVLGVALSTIDIAVHRLPNRLVLPSYAVMLALLGVAAVAGHDLAALGRAVLGGLALAGGYLTLALVRPGQMGGGDVKLAGLTGLALGWLGWPTLVVGAFLAFLLSALVSVGLLISRRIRLDGHLAFGPFLVGATLLAILGSNR